MPVRNHYGSIHICRQAIYLFDLECKHRITWMNTLLYQVIKHPPALNDTGIAKDGSIAFPQTIMPNYSGKPRCLELEKAVI
jgi:hypothetical protein